MAQHKKYFLDRSKMEVKMLPLDSRPADQLSKGEEDEVAEVDEPPEWKLSFERLPMHFLYGSENAHSCAGQSLLTKALLTSPNLRGVTAIDTSMARAQSTASTHSALSAVSTADLTSDGGFTSPARSTTPSPPLPPSLHNFLPLLPPQKLDTFDKLSIDAIPSSVPPLKAIEPPRRHITFACPRPKDESKPREEANKTEEEPPKRKTMLRFACPLKPARDSESKLASISNPRRSISPPPTDTTPVRKVSTPERPRKDSGVSSQGNNSKDSPKSTASSPEVSRSEALRFHEFAAAKPEEDGWILEKPAPRQKITVSDTLRKENAIRKLGEEAEEEAQEEEDEENEAELEEDMDDDVHDIDDLDDDNDDGDHEEEEDLSDDGNETDDEEGFAASDDESEAGSEFELWTPAVTTAATSTDQLDHIRPKQYRTMSMSSMESTVNPSVGPIDTLMPPKRTLKRRNSPKMRPGTPELPDSTDFVCGTLDEDRPLEVAYVSCLEQRRIAKHGVHPQDVDPSFPTSDPEDEDEDDDDEVVDGSDSQAWIAGKPDESDDGSRKGRTRTNSIRKPMAKSPAPSPKRMRSPPPKRRTKSPAPLAVTRGHAARSPPPRRFLTHSPRRGHLSPTHTFTSPRVTRENSFDGNTQSIDLPALARRPQLTHTKSLPRTPNPFWIAHNRGRLAAQLLDGDDAEAVPVADIHSRGPIDIVQGLERKRQRRKEKYWKLQCRHKDAKDKERRPPPGKGAQRMRELGLEMADRCKGYGQRLQLVLSV